MYMIVGLVLTVLATVRCDYGPGHDGEDQIFTEEQKRAMKTRSINIDFPAWTNGIVPYAKTSGFQSSSIHTTALQNAINILQNKTCVRFVPRTSESTYLNFYNTGPSGVCQSYVGMAPSWYQPQEIEIADWCTSPGTRWYSTVHEIVHALGFTHEQCRLDRDDYVNVNMSNPKANGNYKIISVSSAKVVSSYDYDSVMHYPAETGLLTPKDPDAVIGKRDHLSDCDIAKINRYYECDEDLYQKTACPVGGTQEPTTTESSYYYYYEK